MKLPTAWLRCSKCKTAVSKFSISEDLVNNQASVQATCHGVTETSPLSYRAWAQAERYGLPIDVFKPEGGER